MEGAGPEKHIKLTTCSTEYRIGTEYRIQNTAAAKFMYITLPMYLFFIWRLDLAKPLLGPLKGVGPVY